MKIALVLGIIFCLGIMPVMVEAIYTNLPLALIQAFLLWKETPPGCYYEECKSSVDNMLVLSGAKQWILSLIYRAG